MAKDYQKVRPENEDEQAHFDRAFAASKAKSVSERMAAGQKAVYNYREGLKKAVDDSLKPKVAKRKKMMDKEGGF